MFIYVKMALCIQVDVIPNQPPSIAPATSPISISENIDVQTLLYTVNVSDAENDPVVCDVKSINPTSSIFSMWWESTNLGRCNLIIYILNFIDTDCGPFNFATP